MAVNKSVIAAALLTVFNQQDGETDPAAAKNNYATRLANVIGDAILSAEAETGIAVQVNTATGAGATIERGDIV